MRNLPNLPSEKGNSTQWPMFRSAREYMLTCVFFKKMLHIAAYIYQLLHFQTFICKKCYIDCRRKLYSIKSDRICLYLFWGVWRNLYFVVPRLWRYWYFAHVVLLFQSISRLCKSSTNPLKILACWGNWK